MRRAWVLGTLMICLFGGTPAQAGSDDALLKLLIRKGLLTQEDVDALKREIAAEEAAQKAAAPAAAAPAAVAPAETVTTAAPAPGQAPVTEAQMNEAMGQVKNDILKEMAEKEEASISIAATVSTEGRYRLYPNPASRGTKNSSELYLRTAQVDFEARPLSWITLNLTVKSEYFGADTTNEYQESDPTPFIDTGIITFRDDQGFPLYAVLGKRTQPNGAFLGDDRFNTDPISKNAYEVNQVGATAGYVPGFYGLDASITVYRQEQQMDQLFASGLFDNTIIVRPSSVGLAKSSDSITSFIVAATLEPVAGLQLGVSYLSEPGAGTRNQTIGVWGSYTWGKLTAEAEFYAALSREKYARQVTVDDVTTPVLLDQAFKEKILSLGLTWKLLESLEIGGRAELYWDDGLADAAQAWTTKYRLLAGVGYTVYQKGDISVRLIAEYRYTDFRQGGSASQTGASTNHEVFGKVAVTYK